MVNIVLYADALHRAQVIALWKSAFSYSTGRNDPGLSIDRKLEQGDDLLFVALEDGVVAGTVMAGYDGHRGWLYSLAVRTDRRGAGIGRALVRHAEAALTERGCLKINLQVVTGNEAVCAFYEKLGYVVEPRVSMGKAIAANLPPGR